MVRGHKISFFGAALATGLVGLVTLPATPKGHRPPALWKPPRIVFRVRVRWGALVCLRGSGHSQSEMQNHGPIGPE